jgi:D-alanyl-lipoteichoic acid acyltransferase DltB (MBOAT superfamily)
MWAALFIVGLFVAAWFVPGTQLARAVAAFVSVASLMIAVELAAPAGQKLSSRQRWRIRRAKIDSAQLWRFIGCVLFYVFIALSAFLALFQTRHPSNEAMGLLRLAAGVALLYAAAELVFEVCGLCLLVAGYSLPLMHRAPIAARSVGAFWGQRWNIITSAWLRTFVFWPLARRRCAGAGVFCCFLVSGAFHAWPMLVALGPFAALSTVVFFVFQGVVGLAESRLRIHTWPVAIARVWTLVILLVSSPLYIDPGLRLFGF